ERSRRPAVRSQTRGEESPRAPSTMVLPSGEKARTYSRENEARIAPRQLFSRLPDATSHSCRPPPVVASASVLRSGAKATPAMLSPRPLSIFCNSVPVAASQIRTTWLVRIGSSRGPPLDLPPGPPGPPGPRPTSAIAHVASHLPSGDTAALACDV